MMREGKMRAVIQRVQEASVVIDGKIYSEINQGLLILLAIKESDTEEDLKYLLDKTVPLRIFEDEQGKMNRSLEEVHGEVLVVSQFTLYGDVRKGKRPSFSESASYEKGKEYYEKFVETVQSSSIPCKTGCFGADMKVKLINDGPVTIIVDSEVKNG